MVTGLHELHAVVTKMPNSSGMATNAVQGSGEAAGVAGTPFSDLLTNAIGKVGELEDQARAAIDGFMTGKGVDVHQVMIASEKASMGFEMALAIRNKAVQSYQSVMSMQF